MGARYDGNPALGYVVISGLGQNVETYLSKTVADDAVLTAMGGTTAWVAAAEELSLRTPRHSPPHHSLSPPPDHLPLSREY